MADVQVLPIQRGSIIVMRDIDFPVDGRTDPDRALAEAQWSVREEIIYACGHDEFVIVWCSGGSAVEVLDPGDVLRLIREAVELTDGAR